MKDNIDQVIDGLCESSITAAEPSELPYLAVQEQPKDNGVKRTLIQYIRQDNTFQPVGEIELVETLPPFAYKMIASQTGPVFQKFTTQTDELLKFENSKMSEVLEEVKKFWTLKQSFNQLGFLHNRGILLYGPPGSGKSSLIQQITEQMVGQGDVVFFTSCQINPVIGCLKAFRQVEPSRRAVVVLEDLDEYMSYQERDLLQLLDGENSVDNVLYLGTTNYINKLSQRLMRPGRFDKKVLIDFPPVEGRLVYLQNKLGDIEAPEKIKMIAEMTDKFSFGHLRELVIAVFCLGEDLEKTIARLKDMEYKALPERGKLAFESVGKKLKIVEAKAPSDLFDADATYVLFHDNSGIGLSVPVVFESIDDVEEFLAMYQHKSGVRRFNADIYGSGDKEGFLKWASFPEDALVKKSGISLLRHLMSVFERKGEV